MRVARPYKKRDPVRTLAWLVQHAVNASGLQCSAAKQMGQTQFSTDVTSVSGPIADIPIALTNVCFRGVKLSPHR
jgi:hypothetical protein